MKIKSRGKKRVGRGYGSGKGGHTVGRGQKGQKIRSKISPLFEGTKVKKSLIQRLPLQRGRGKLKPKPAPIEVNLSQLNKFSSGAKVDVEALIKRGIVDERAKRVGVKVLNSGKLEKNLTVTIPTTKPAREKIEKAGGKIEYT